MNTAWKDSEAGSTEVEQVVYLSNLIGADGSLVQPGGGNTSVKVEEVDGFGRSVGALVVKGSGTDLRTIEAGGFTYLYLERLGLVSKKDSISDEEMMSLMRGCMLAPDRDPLPSVETPLHSLLPARFVAHTHDVATLSLTDTPSAAEHVRRVFGDSVAFLEYVRPGFPLAKRLSERLPEGPPAGAIALVMEKHGLAVWGETAKECWENLCAVIGKAEQYVADAAKGKRVFGAASAPVFDEGRRRELALAILPVIRGELTRGGFGCVLHLDDSEETLEAISGEGFAAVASRGVMTPEHILRAGVRPLVLSETDPHAAAVGLKPDPHISQLSVITTAIRRYRDEYADYAARHGVAPIADYLKTIVIPGVGIVCAGKDRRNALVAAECYSATMRVMAGAEAVERFEPLSEDDACEMEYWPLERRKIEESNKSRKDLDGKVAMVIGAGSGIGRAAALRFAEEGAHVVCADLDLDAAEVLAAEINGKAPERAVGLPLDVTDAEGVASAVREAVLWFGGIDVLFYSAGVAPELHAVTEMPDEEVQRQLDVHYAGAVIATREVSRVMLAQGVGPDGRAGRLVYNASKAAFAPGVGAAAYGASKAALVHYVRNAANELGQHGITANYINADAVDTPLFRGVVRQRAEAAGVSEEAMLERYRERGALREATVPPEAVAEAALWLASERSAHTTGFVITVGGGAEGFPR
jgi:rhamnulose-1-phosphate aldolase/alcohol dehydrogenase